MSEFKQSLIVTIAGAILSAILSFVIAIVTTAVTDAQSKQAIDASRQIADDQSKLTVRLYELEQWRKQPELSLLMGRTIEQNSLQATVQNTGGRHAVLFSIRFRHVDIKTGGDGATQTVDSGVESKTARIDLSNFDLRNEYYFSPPLTIESGDVLTLVVKLPHNAGSGTVDCSWNSPTAERWFNVGHVINRSADVFLFPSR